MSFSQIAYNSRAIADDTAKSLFTFSLPTTLDALGGRVDYFLYATDGTDVQGVAGSFVFSAVNKAGTVTCVANNADGTASDQDASALTGSSTATLVPSIAASGTTVTVSFKSDSSLTTTSGELRFTVKWFSNGTANSRVIPITFL